MTDSSQPIAGWYPDPENANAERWWDGASWTDHRRPSTTAPAAPPAPVSAAPAPVADPGAFAAPGASLAGTAPVAPGAAQTPSYAPASSATVSPYASPYGIAPSAAPGYAAPAYTPAEPSNGMAVVGLVLALGGLVINFGGLTSLAGGIVSTIALARASKMRAQGFAGHRWGMALAGTISGYVLFVLIVGAYIAFFSFLLNNPDLGTYDGSSFT